MACEATACRPYSLPIAPQVSHNSSTQRGPLMKSKLQTSLTTSAGLLSARLTCGLAFGCLFTALSSLSSEVHAAPSTLVVGSDIEFSGGQSPASDTKPWIEMTISDITPGK